MKTKRILSLLLAIVLALTLLPTAALATEDIKTVAITVTGVTSAEWGKPRPGIGAFSVADPNLQISNITWTAADDGKVTYNNRVVITVDIKAGVDAKFAKQTSVKTSVNGESKGIVKKRASDTQFVITYTIQVANPNRAAEEAALQATADAAIAATKTDVQSYDTFDYRAYANVYPDVKAAYGYDAQKLYAHYVNYGKAEGRVAYYINAADNPKTGATYYKNANTGTTYTDTTRDANVPATYLDPLPPSNYDVVQNWYDHQLTQPQSMSNAKLVAEQLRLYTLLKNEETGAHYPLVTMHRYWDIAEEIGARSKWAELLYCYENNAKPKTHWRSSDVTYERIQDVKNGRMTSAEWQRTFQTDYLILIHWLYGFYYNSSVREDIFPTPPADPGTVSGVTTSTTTTTTAPAAPAAKTVGGFSDVLESSSFAQPVVWAVEKGITGGKTSTTFAPGETCTQAQILTFLWRAKGQPEPKGTVEMEGFDSTKYYYKAVQWAAEQGIVEGRFNPVAPCTRATAMMYMWKQAGSPSAKAVSFSDVSSGAAYAPAVNWAVANGVTTGTTSTTFAPDSPCTRGQIVTFLYRAFK